MAQYADSIYTDESLASQLLRNAVGANDPTSSVPAVTTQYSLKEDLISASSPRASVLQYRLQGLAITQTQDESAAKGKSPRKRTPDTSSFNPPGLVVGTPESLEASSHDLQHLSKQPRANEAKDLIKLAVNNAVTGEVVVVPSTFPETSQRLKTTKSGQIPSPALTPPSPPGHKRKLTRRKRQRSLSLVSDDSFAGPLPKELDHKRFIATSETFQIPLSELGQTQDISMSESRSRDDDELSTTSSQDPRADRVLAPSSEPSAQGYDASHSQGSAASNSQHDHPIYPEGQGQTMETEDEDSHNSHQQYVGFPSSAEAELVWQNIWKEDNEAQGSVTPPLEDLSLAVETAIPAQTAASDATSMPRSILSMAAPWKHHRYQAALAQGQSIVKASLANCTTQALADASDYQETQPSMSSRLPAKGCLPSTSYDADIPPALADISEETQPSTSSNLPATGHMRASLSSSPVPPVEANELEETQFSSSSNLPPTGHRIQEEIQRSPAQRQQPTTRNVFSNFAYHSDIDIVPDSEATQSEALRGLTMSPVRLFSSPILAAKPPSKPTSAPVIVESAEKPGSSKGKGKSPAKPQKEEQEPDSSEEKKEDEVPLANVVVKSRPARNKPVAKHTQGDVQLLMLPPKGKEKTVALTAGPSEPKMTRARERIAAASRAGREVIPSSISAENILYSPRKKKPRKVRQTGVESTKALVGPVTPVRPPPREDSGGETTVPDEVLTELGDSTEEEDDDILPVPLPTSRKRKRAAPVARSHAANKASSKSVAKLKATPTITPTSRSNKRMKSESILRSGSSAPATRVLALWKKDGHYYPGTVYSVSETTPGRYIVKFDDETEDSVDVTNLRRCELQVGDHVLLTNASIRAEVIDASQCVSEREVIVELDKGNGPEKLSVELVNIRVASRSVMSQWKDRVLSEFEIVTMIKPRSSKIPSTPSRASVQSRDSAGSAKTQLLFARVGFVVTFSPGLKDSEVMRRELAKAIEDHGGTIIDDWGKLFTIQGTHYHQGKRWKINKSDVHLVKGKNLDVVYLLADEANMKPKFLIALALGVPCLRLDWFWDSIESNERQKWLSYLLPAGTSEQLSARVSQMVDMDWGNCIQYLEDIMDNRVPSKLFDGKAVLCLSPAFMPQPYKKGSMDIVTSESIVPRIVLAMGASYVEAVAEAGHASRRLPNYDYVIVKDASEMKTTGDGRENRVPFSWVKECLVAGRFLPLKR